MAKPAPRPRGVVRVASSPRAPAAVPGIRSLPEVDAFRALAIALVFTTHAEGWISPFTLDRVLPFERALLHIGYTGVSLFFVLSAFLLSRPFWAAAAGGPPVDVADFARRRFWRIVPLYATVVIATTLFYARTPADLARGLPYLAFSYNQLIPADAQFPREISGVWWSLSTEMQFYALLPILALALESGRRRWCGVAAVAVVAAGYVTHVLHGWPGLTVHGIYAVGVSVIGRFPLFACGIAAAFVYERFGARIRARAARSRWLRAGGADAILAASVVGFCAALGSTARTTTYVTLELVYPVWHVGEGIVWATILLTALLAPLRLRAAFTARPLVRIGELSYSIYLLHAPILGAGVTLLRALAPEVASGWNPVTLGATLALAALASACSAVTFRWIEQPMIRYGRRVETRDRALAPAEPAPEPVRTAA
jgi:peptidoglycan/LPS O-acetylase OafA/YrhL